MRKPNRKYKVPKQVLAERLAIGWCNVARIRALCLATHGYDPEIENWDQSPFHNNESGSANVGTLAVAGSLVPLVEGHADTRERWTANLVTFSNKERILADGPPYCELMFKAEGNRLELRLKEYVRGRGFGSWLTVATSPKGSYRTNDVLTFLERHLPYLTEGRRWRIIQADDYSAHLAPQVFRLCWSRGYVFIPHGGGATPVVQTPDTDLNQHVKRDYIDYETSEFVRQMQDGITVPRLRQEQCIDLMYEVLSKRALHLGAAEGYKKTGMTVALDGTMDHEIVREAAVFWGELRMREKINSAVAEVTEEVAAGRLSWSREDVQRLILPYPARREVDAVLANMQDDTMLDEGECPYRNDDDGASAADSDEEHAEGDGEPCEEDDAHPAVAGEPAASEVAAAEPAIAEPAVAGAPCAIEVSAGAADHVTYSREKTSALQSAREVLLSAGLMQAVVNIDYELAKERRRLRGACKADSDVMLALARQRDEEDARERKRRRLIEDANARTTNVAKLKAAAEAAKAELKATKAAVAAAETLLETKHAMKTFALEGLGIGKKNCGGAAGKKRRAEVLDRMARLGLGLSAAQRNDFGWWKDRWDAKMSVEHGDAWPRIFAEWVQQLIADVEGGAGNAFSLFVHSETNRVLADELALQVP